MKNVSQHLSIFFAGIAGALTVQIAVFCTVSMGLFGVSMTQLITLFLGFSIVPVVLGLGAAILSTTNSRHPKILAFILGLVSMIVGIATLNITGLPERVYEEMAVQRVFIIAFVFVVAGFCAQILVSYMIRKIQAIGPQDCVK